MKTTDMRGHDGRCHWTDSIFFSHIDDARGGGTGGLKVSGDSAGFGNHTTSAGGASCAGI